MFTKKTAAPQLETPGTIIGKGVFIEAAKMTGKESVRIDGLFQGTVDIDGSLMISDTGNIKGDIKAKYILAAGTINGNILCESVLHLASTSKVIGDVNTQTIIVDEGSQIDGRYWVGMNNSDAANASAGSESSNGGD